MLRTPTIPATKSANAKLAKGSSGKGSGKARKSAISKILSCERASAARTSSTSRGDSCPHPPRTAATPRRKSSQHLGYDKVANIIAATRHACHIGMPFNRFITISWEKGHVIDHTTATINFLNYARGALFAKGERTAFVWSQEWGRVVGQHVHILIHVPLHLTAWFTKLQRGWLKRCGATRGKNVIKTTPIGHSYAAAFSSGPLAEAYQRNLENVKNYILKDAEYKALCLLPQPASLRGSPVHGKRSATSENIGVAARAKRAGAS